MDNNNNKDLASATETKRNLLGRNQQFLNPSKVSPSTSNSGSAKKAQAQWPTKKEMSAVAFSPNGYIAFNSRQKNEIDVQECVENTYDLAKV